MANRKYFLMLAIIGFSFIAKAQTTSFQQVDSTTYARYTAGDWKSLVELGNNAINAGVDYPILRLRMAYAKFMTGNYAGALGDYSHVLKDDSRNQTAHYFSYLCNKYLGNNNGASYHAGYVDTLTLKNEQISSFGLLEAGLENSVKTSANANRGTGNYTRVFLSNRLGWQLQLEQSVGYYNQSITSNNPIAIQIPGGPLVNQGGSATYSDSQFEYYGKLGLAVNSNLTVLGAYHYLNTSYGTTTYQNHVGLVGLKYWGYYFAVQADADFSSISNIVTQQYNGQLSIYPLGNLNLYTVSRLSVQSGDVQQTIFNQTLGFKVVNKLWLEANAGFGKMDNYLEADALYVYNSIDVTKFKAGGTAFFPLNKHAVVYLNYAFEQKQDFYLNNNYNQHSITGGFTWKF
ncbi:hypothetical protein [Mucilaginibacter boryungensis]|uniref:Tetratricopeptide repeat protein n=1 Tax=Mucilaginibacter boryungensis TaxID=768480 RepID=A0ABR9XGE6_9SPHI|nr:hypothetical protein [Mucilaginibacter boryungensis]MBE9666270.1 hypothetical protein [Mucilaginibacter boryungensis]